MTAVMTALIPAYASRPFLAVNLTHGHFTESDLSFPYADWFVKLDEVWSHCGLNNSDCDVFTLIFADSTMELCMTIFAGAAESDPSNWTGKCLSVACAAGSATRFVVTLLLIWFSDPRV